MGFKGVELDEIKGSDQMFERQPTYYDDLNKDGFVLRLWENKLGDKITVRFIGKGYPARRHWVPTSKGKKFPAMCTRFNPETQTFDPKGEYDCLACYFSGKKRKPGGDEKRVIGGASAANFVNVINRSLQKAGNDYPIQIVQLGKDLGDDINAAKEAWSVRPNDPESGYDMVFTFTSGKKANEIKIGLGAVVSKEGKERTLSEQELAYELIDLDAVYTSLLPKRRDEIISYFYNGFIEDMTEAGLIIDESLEMNLITEEDVDQIKKSLATISTKRGGSSSPVSVPQESVPDEESVPVVSKAPPAPKPQAKAPTPPAPPAQPGTSAEPPQKKTLVPPPPRRPL